MPSFDPKSVAEALRRDFPDAAKNIDSSMVGLLHTEMHCFAAHVQHQIDSGNRVELQRCYEWLRQLMLYGDPEVQNAVGVSVLEHLNTADGKAKRKWALDAMPSVLKKAYDGLTRGA